MTQEIIEMARQAGLHRNQHNLASNPVQYRFSYDGTEEALTAFAKLVENAAFKRWAAQTKLAVEDEREACAKIAFNAKTYIEAAKAIRARGQE